MTTKQIPSIPAGWTSAQAIGHVTLASGSILTHCWIQHDGLPGEDMFFSAKGTTYFTRPIDRNGRRELYSFPAGSTLRYQGNPVHVFIAGGIAEVVR